ncbi:endonuclease/exonuclease/phosphatase family metal-dependent hydrolase [Gelidibacter algens]|uniref:Endonuclease/exonuclease/phosphatase family metal-dependent hydrolase n=1 Tax=Gelidibacter algens TaxID=49280 RepID=A0A1A7R4R0_9FLAO|nr:endonuclease/exonuclease/phosphatase family protein [Gelidibacter algens]OBX27245.1 endonuclease [Gelidibacter algens]RAJ22110.1 endonuclease/exonuclease/phosphatase family metal-dependent hydrolase [Gelidibacter algens]
MISITDIPPIAVQENLNLLIADLNSKIPSKQLDRNLLIATWNIRAFGNLTRKWDSDDDDSPKRDLHSVLCIAEIISRFDIIAVQEVKDNIRALRDTLKVLGENWSFLLTDVNKGKVGNGERMAYLFDTRRVRLSGLAGELVVPEEWEENIGDHALSKQFVRSPYAVSFQSNKHTFILVTLHILYGTSPESRIEELRGIAKWLSSWAGNINAYHQDLIALGDFNIDERGDLLERTFLSEGLYIPPQLQNERVTRSIFNATKYYDQIAWFNSQTNGPKLSMEFLSGGNYDFVPFALQNRQLTKNSLSWLISDHYPLWAEFKI